MLRRYIIIINCLFIILGLFLGDRIYKIWKPIEHPREDSSASQQNQTTSSAPTLIQPKKPPRKAYQIIVDKDLFRPERTEWQPSVQIEEDKGTVATALKIRVYGIVISDDLKHAWIKAEGKNRKMEKVSEGESIEGWTVTKIESEYVELSKGEETVQQNLIVPGEPKPRTTPKSLAPKKKRRKPPQPQKKKRGKK